MNEPASNWLPWVRLPHVPCLRLLSRFLCVGGEIGRRTSAKRGTADHGMVVRLHPDQLFVSIEHRQAPLTVNEVSRKDLVGSTPARHTVHFRGVPHGRL